MNNKDIIGILLVALAALSAFLIVKPIGAEFVRCVGKAAWYMPYALLLGSIHCFRVKLVRPSKGK